MLNRRHFMKHVAGYSLMAAPSLQFVQGLRAAQSTLKKQNKSLIILWMSGGPPTIDLWDMKPESNNGGPHRPVQTAAPGVMITEHMPKTAAQFKNLSIVRSLVTSEGDHNRGTILMTTGRTPSPVVQYPTIGAITSHQLTPSDLDLPGFISIGGGGMRTSPGFLGMNYAAFTVQNPGTPPPNMRPPSSLGSGDELDERVRRRQRLFYSIEDQFTTGQAPHAQTEADLKKYGGAALNHRDIYGKAFSLMVSPRGKVFDLASEPRSLVDEYGNNNFGRGCLLARKLVEAGVTAVEVSLGGWDLHGNTHATLQSQRLPVLDSGMGTLVKDLVDRGLWDNTVVVWMGEFGRTPRINQNAGRDHWPRCWSVVIGGGGIKGGVAYGATDKDGTAVADKPATITDLYATLFRGLGLDPTTQIRDNLGRPMAIAGDNPKAISELIS
ncbi:MAG: DUF1501 domain-containing protein [Gemmataceae bacterium]